MQKDFVDGALGTKEAVAIVPAVVERVKKGEEAGECILFTRDTHIFMISPVPANRCFSMIISNLLCPCIQRRPRSSQSLTVRQQGSAIRSDFYRKASTIRKTFGREHCYRYGGDEFLVLLKTSDIIDDKAEVSITQGLEEKLSECTAIELPGLDLRVTAACGYVYGFAANEQKIAAMVIQADSNVYIAKSRRDGMFIGSQFTP